MSHMSWSKEARPLFADRESLDNFLAARVIVAGEALLLAVGLRWSRPSTLITCQWLLVIFYPVDGAGFLTCNIPFVF